MKGMSSRIKLYTLKALAQELGTSYGYLKHVMLRIKKGEIEGWRGYRFIALGDGKRSNWIAYPEDLDIELIEADGVEPEEAVLEAALEILQPTEEVDTSTEANPNMLEARLLIELNRKLYGDNFVKTEFKALLQTLNHPLASED
jgi:hypothetical protein